MDALLVQQVWYITVVYMTQLSFQYIVIGAGFKQQDSDGGRCL